jgi:hypothetical protein
LFEWALNGGRDRHGSSDCPNESEHLAGDGCGDHDLWFAGRSEAAVAGAKSDLRLPGDVANDLRQGFDPVMLASNAATTGACDQLGAKLAIWSLRRSTLDSASVTA